MPLQQYCKIYRQWEYFPLLIVKDVNGNALLSQDLLKSRELNCLGEIS